MEIAAVRDTVTLRPRSGRRRSLRLESEGGAQWAWIRLCFPGCNSPGSSPITSSCPHSPSALPLFRCGPWGPPSCHRTRKSTFASRRFWIKIFAVSFGMGVVSGIVIPFQIGTNWSRFSDAAADVAAALW